ncbi:MAG: hypothetical protein QM754_21225 [Tepidisphaeraceae bacterium]
MEFGGENFLPLPDRALFWPRLKTLIVSDLHVGKAAVFRRRVARSHRHHRPGFIAAE